MSSHLTCFLFIYKALQHTCARAKPKANRKHVIGYEGETQMRYVTSVERLAIQRGMQQGIQRQAQIILMRLLQKRWMHPHWMN